MKSALSLLLILLLLCPAGLAERFAVTYAGSEEGDGYALLLTDDGVPLTPPGTYGSIDPLTPAGTPEALRRYRVEPLAPVADLGGADTEQLDYYDYHREALMDADGQLLTGFDYCGFNWLSDGSVAFIVAEDGQTRTGVMDANAHVLMPPSYADVQPLGGGRWLALAPTGTEGVFSAVVADADGGEIDTGLRTDCYYLPEVAGDLGIVPGVLDRGGGYVYVDRDGAERFRRTFDMAYDFYGDLAAVEVDGRFGLIDRGGELVVPAEYDYIDHDDNPDVNAYAAVRGAELTVFNATTGAVLLRKDLSPSTFVSANLSSPGLLWALGDEVIYCYSLDGGLLGKLESAEKSGRYYQIVRCDAEAPVIIENSGEWPLDVARLTDLEGNALGGDYRYIVEGLWQDGAARYVVSAGAVRTGPDGETYADWRRWRYGVIDERGAELLPTVYLDYIQVLSPDRYWVATADRTGMVDGSGKWYYAIDRYEDLMD